MYCTTNIGPIPDKNKFDINFSVSTLVSFFYHFFAADFYGIKHCLKSM